MQFNNTLTKLLALFTFASLYFVTIPSAEAQIIVRQDEEIKKMVDEISAANLETLVRKLASFDTRHSLSTTKDKKKGVGAAREWVKSEFEKYAKASGGRMNVEMDRYTVKADGRRIPNDV